mmetsp:Transcript_25641/g.74188  ORF Transcript_25641/g.74188 Transcript_25641/m.74188 type:complete len:523 (-) Transcript_25641:1300-2868(-)|eukprot:CAMPEP_0181049040 /NCGR_PEP_ID=MMETSP1070-20121207/15753_1 /TAXON_ID=265543 /ORGANISM="Minutocellus polymorphus, Strain NH13" /LENGTH=522 /DNA_ID=CAMNT_0023127857 /DNA_START=243 /DNA_END=1811 /DNA_ORIENTATION=-
MPRGSRSTKRTSAAAAVKAEPTAAAEDAASDTMMIDDNDVDMTTALDDDPIIREIDVYISPELASTAALVQYPLRPSSFIVGGKPNTQFHPSAARTKPRHSMLELDYAVPAPSGHYSYHDVEELDGTRTFASTAVSVSTHMALGKLDDTGDRVDLIPLHTVLQMRPTFSHIDAVDPQQVAAAEQKAAEAQAAQQQQAAAGTKPLLFKRKESDRAVTQRRQSFAHLKSEQDAEEWIVLQVADGGGTGLNDDDDEYEYDPQKDAVLDKVTCKHRSHIIRLAKTAVGGNVGYVNSLNYLPVTEDLTGTSDACGGGGTAAGTNFTNIIITPENVDQYKSDLTTRIATLLTSSGGIPVPYPVFRSQYVGQDLDPVTGRVAHVPDGRLTEEMLIDCLSATAALVRGNFVLKSSLCGLSPQVVEARDVVLIILNKNGRIRRQSLLKALTESAEGEAMDAAVITEHLINQLLEPIATRGQNAMALRVPDDETFAARFHTQAEQHEAYWEKREEALAHYVSAYEELEKIVG